MVSSTGAVGSQAAKSALPTTTAPLAPVISSEATSAPDQAAPPSTAVESPAPAPIAAAAPSSPTTNDQGSTATIGVAERAALLVAAPDDPQKVRTYGGTVVWRTESVSAGLVVSGNDPQLIAFRTRLLQIENRGEAAFNGRLSLLAPPGWQVAAPAGFGQRQYIAAHSGTLHAEFRLQALEGQARIEIANSIALRLAPDSGGAPFETQFVLMGASCWWTAGTFANFDGEGFDRSYLPEDRPSLNESYVARNLQSVRWEKHVFSESVLDIESLFKGSSGVLYGQTNLRSPFNREARLTAGSNNGVKVWMHGSLVLRRHQRTTFRPTLNEENWTADVSLRSGDNPVMVKWVRGAEPYQFSLTVSDRQGRALPDVGNTSW